MSDGDHLPDDEAARFAARRVAGANAVLRQGERDARSGERAIWAAIRFLDETWLPLLEALRQRIDLDRLDPLDAVAQVALDAEVQRLRRSLDATEPPEVDQLGREEKSVQSALRATSRARSKAGKRCAERVRVRMRALVRGLVLVEQMSCENGFSAAFV